MVIFYYEPVLDGLLCALFDTFVHKQFPDALLAYGDIPPLWQTRVHRVETDRDHAARVYRHLADKLGKFGMEQVTQAWLSEEPDTGLTVLRYLDLIVREGGSRQHDLADARVLAIHQMARRVNGERHLLTGFVRFQKTAEGTYFAAIRPRHNVLPLLVDHFADRFGSMRWVLYDTGREYGVYWDGLSLKPMDMDPALLDANGNLPENLLADDEKLFQHLWKRYFSAISIKERRNPRLQVRCMPRRFWRYMTETSPTDEPRTSST